MVENSKFTSNEADAGGAVQFKQDAATIRGCAFTGNTAKDTGAFSRRARRRAVQGQRAPPRSLTARRLGQPRGGAGRRHLRHWLDRQPDARGLRRRLQPSSATADDGGAAIGSWLEAWLLNASSFVDNVDNSNDAVMRLQKGHMWVRKCTFTTAQNLVDSHDRGPGPTPTARRRWRRTRRSTIACAGTTPRTTTRAGPSLRLGVVSRRVLPRCLHRAPYRRARGAVVSVATRTVAAAITRFRGARLRVTGDILHAAACLLDRIVLESALRQHIARY